MNINTNTLSLTMYLDSHEYDTYLIRGDGCVVGYAGGTVPPAHSHGGRNPIRTHTGSPPSSSTTSYEENLLGEAVKLVAVTPSWDIIYESAETTIFRGPYFPHGSHLGEGVSCSIPLPTLGGV